MVIKLCVRLVAKLVYILGIDELQRPICLFSTLLRAEKNWVTPEFTEVKYQARNLRKDLSLRKIQKAKKMKKKLTTNLKQNVLVLIKKRVQAHKSELKNILLDQLGLSECISLISFEILIMFFMMIHCWKDLHGMLKGRLMKYFNPSNTFC